MIQALKAPNKSEHYVKEVTHEGIIGINTFADKEYIRLWGMG